MAIINDLTVKGRVDIKVDVSKFFINGKIISDYFLDKKFLNNITDNIGFAETADKLTNNPAIVSLKIGNDNRQFLNQNSAFVYNAENNRYELSILLNTLPNTHETHTYAQLVDVLGLAGKNYSEGKYGLVSNRNMVAIEGINGAILETNRLSNYMRTLLPNIYDGCYYNGEFIVVGSSDNNFSFNTSNDGITWSNYNGSGIDRIDCIVCGNGYALYIYHNNLDRIMIMRYNYVTKSFETAGSIPTTNRAIKAVYGRIYGRIYGDDGEFRLITKNKIFKSSDNGDTWTEVRSSSFVRTSSNATTTINESSRIYSDIVFANGYFVVLSAEANTNAAKLFVSHHGDNVIIDDDYINKTLIGNKSLRNIAYGNGNFSVVLSTTSISSSTDMGITNYAASGILNFPFSFIDRAFRDNIISYTGVRYNNFTTSINVVAKPISYSHGFFYLNTYNLRNNYISSDGYNFISENVESGISKEYKYGKNSDDVFTNRCQGIRKISIPTPSGIMIISQNSTSVDILSSQYNEYDETDHTHNQYATHSELQNAIQNVVTNASALQTLLDNLNSSLSTNYYTKSSVDSLLAGKSSTSHNHDSRYYTENEVNSLLAGKANSSHNHSKSQITDLTEAEPEVNGNGLMKNSDKYILDNIVDPIHNLFSDENKAEIFIHNNGNIEKRGFHHSLIVKGRNQYLFIERNSNNEYIYEIYRSYDGINFSQSGKNILTILNNYYPTITNINDFVINYSNGLFVISHKNGGNKLVRIEDNELLSDSACETPLPLIIVKGIDLESSINDNFSNFLCVADDDYNSDGSFQVLHIDHNSNKKLTLLPNSFAVNRHSSEEIKNVYKNYYVTYGGQILKFAIDESIGKYRLSEIALPEGYTAVDVVCDNLYILTNNDGSTYVLYNNYNTEEEISVNNYLFNRYYDDKGIFCIYSYTNQGSITCRDVFKITKEDHSYSFIEHNSFYLTNSNIIGMMIHHNMGNYVRISGNDYYSIYPEQSKIDNEMLIRHAVKQGLVTPENVVQYIEDYYAENGMVSENHSHTVNDITDLATYYYNKTQMDSALAGKASLNHNHQYTYITGLNNDVLYESMSENNTKPGFIKMGDYNYLRDENLKNALKIKRIPQFSPTNINTYDNFKTSVEIAPDGCYYLYNTEYDINSSNSKSYVLRIRKYDKNDIIVDEYSTLQGSVLQSYGDYINQGPPAINLYCRFKLIALRDACIILVTILDNDNGRLDHFAFINKDDFKVKESYLEEVYKYEHKEISLDNTICLKQYKIGDGLHHTQSMYFWNGVYQYLDNIYFTSIYNETVMLKIDKINNSITSLGNVDSHPTPNKYRLLESKVYDNSSVKSVYSLLLKVNEENITVEYYLGITKFSDNGFSYKEVRLSGPGIYKIFDEMVTDQSYYNNTIREADRNYDFIIQDLSTNSGKRIQMIIVDKFNGVLFRERFRYVSSNNYYTSYENTSSNNISNYHLPTTSNKTSNLFCLYQDSNSVAYTRLLPSNHPENDWKYTIYSDSNNSMIDINKEERMLPFNYFRTIYQTLLVRYTANSITTEPTNGCIDVISKYGKNVYIVTNPDYTNSNYFYVSGKYVQPNYEEYLEYENQKLSLMIKEGRQDVKQEILNSYEKICTRDNIERGILNNFRMQPSGNYSSEFNTFITNSSMKADSDFFVTGNNNSIFASKDFYGIISVYDEKRKCIKAHINLGKEIMVGLTSRNPVLMSFEENINLGLIGLELLNNSSPSIQPVRIDDIVFCQDRFVLSVTVPINTDRPNMEDKPYASLIITISDTDELFLKANKHYFIPNTGWSFSSYPKKNKLSYDVYSDKLLLYSDVNSLVMDLYLSLNRGMTFESIKINNDNEKFTANLRGNLFANGIDNYFVFLKATIYKNNIYIPVLDNIGGRIYICKGELTKQMNFNYISSYENLDFIFSKNFIGLHETKLKISNILFEGDSNLSFLLGTHTANIHYCVIDTVRGINSIVKLEENFSNSDYILEDMKICRYEDKKFMLIKYSNHNCGLYDITNNTVITINESNLFYLEYKNMISFYDSGYPSGKTSYAIQNHLEEYDAYKLPSNVKHVVANSINSNDSLTVHGKYLYQIDDNGNNEFIYSNGCMAKLMLNKDKNSLYLVVSIDQGKSFYELEIDKVLFDSSMTHTTMNNTINRADIRMCPLKDGTVIFYRANGKSQSLNINTTFIFINNLLTRDVISKFMLQDIGGVSSSIIDLFVRNNIKVNSYTFNSGELKGIHNMVFQESTDCKETYYDNNYYKVTGHLYILNTDITNNTENVKLYCIDAIRWFTENSVYQSLLQTPLSSCNLNIGGLINTEYLQIEPKTGFVVVKIDNGNNSKRLLFLSNGRLIDRNYTGFRSVTQTDNQSWMTNARYEFVDSHCDELILSKKYKATDHNSGNPHGIRFNSERIKSMNHYSYNNGNTISEHVNFLNVYNPYINSTGNDFNLVFSKIIDEKLYIIADRSATISPTSDFPSENGEFGNNLGLFVLDLSTEKLNFICPLDTFTAKLFWNNNSGAYDDGYYKTYDIIEKRNSFAIIMNNYSDIYKSPNNGNYPQATYELFKIGDFDNDEPIY